MIPVNPDWSRIVLDLYVAHGTYHAILNELAGQGAMPCDHSHLCYIRMGRIKTVKWSLGAALLNLHAKLKPR